MTIQFDNFILNNIFSFVTDENDRDAVYNVSRHFRRMYRHVAPSNAYRFALMNNNIHLARILFDMERIVPTYNMMALAVQRNQIDHVEQLLPHVKPLTNADIRRLLLCAWAAHSQPLTLLFEQKYLEANQSKTSKLLYKKRDFIINDAFIAVCHSSSVDFLRWLVDTRRLVWWDVDPKTFARYATVARISLLLETTNQEDDPILHFLAHLFVVKKFDPACPVQKFALDAVDGMKEENAKESFLIQLAQVITDEIPKDDCAYKFQFDVSIFDYLVARRSGYDIGPLLSFYMKKLARGIGADESVYSWLSQTLAGINTTGENALIDTRIAETLETLKSLCRRYFAESDIDRRRVALQHIERCAALYPVVDRHLIEFLYDIEQERFEIVNLFLRRAIAIATAQGDEPRRLLHPSMITAAMRSLEPAAQETLCIATHYSSLVLIRKRRFGSSKNPLKQ